jgi:heme exporter protein A
MAGQGQPAVSLIVSNLACARGGRVLFSRLSLALAAGGAALVTGPNGIGKSSLLRLVAGLLDPFEGSVSIGGRVALADENPALDPRLALGDALGFWAGLDKGFPVDEALAALGIAHLAEVPVRILSTGQRKRAVLARTLASGAHIWLLDEPGNGLDSASLDRLGVAMAAHRARGGIIIAASHQPLVLPDAVSVVLTA